MYLTEQQRIEAEAICDRILETCKRLDYEFKKLRQASDQFTAICNEHFPVTSDKAFDETIDRVRDAMTAQP